MRDTYKKELNKQNKSTGSGYDDGSTQWKFFESMSFLRNTETPRKMVCNISTPVNDEDISNSPESCYIDIENNDQSTSEKHSDATMVSDL